VRETRLAARNLPRDSRECSKYNYKFVIMTAVIPVPGVVPKVSSSMGNRRSSQNAYQKAGTSRRKQHRSYHDRIDLVDDFESIHAREGRLEPSSNLATTTERLPQRGTIWSEGSSWVLEDDVELSLDPTSAFYDEALEGPVTIKEPVSVRKPKKKKSTVSVSNLHPFIKNFY